MLDHNELYSLVYENIRLLKNMLKSIHNQQEALIYNDIFKIQESALQQADFVEKINGLQSEIRENLEQEFKANGLDWESGMPQLNEMLPAPWNKKISHLFDLQEVYRAEIEEEKSNNRILMENALEFIQQQMRIIVDFAKENPFYGRRNDEKKSINHLLNKKL